MNKFEYISRNFARAENKKYEHYVVTRIWHLLNDLEIKFVTQQYVKRPEGNALADMYFPQLRMYLEIKEGHHKHQIQKDELREADIINATGLRQIKIDVTKSFDDINTTIDDIIKELKKRKSEDYNFKIWDIEAEQNPETYIKKGYIDLKDDVAFERSVDAINCFGKQYKGNQKGGVKHPKEENKLIWFPKIYENKLVSNILSSDDIQITEKLKLPDKAKEHIDSTVNNKIHFRIVFARVKSNLGDIRYRFKGEYKLDLEATNYKDGLIWKRVKERVKTYSATNVIKSLVF